MIQSRAGVLLGFVIGLVVATAATAGAARLITGKQVRDGSIGLKDLSKSVRSQLARAGTPGPSGPKGDPGQSGKDGSAGPPGPFTSVLPSGKTVRGAVFLTTTGTGYSFGFALPAPPAVHVRAFGSGATAECPGTVADPQAAPGHLCVYQANNSGASVCVFASDDPFSSCTSATRYGFAGSSSGQFYGQWAVTAP